MKKALMIMLAAVPLYCLQVRKDHANDMRLFFFEFDGRTRSSLVFAPVNPEPGPRPLLLVLHGGGGRPKGIVSMTRRQFNILADKDKFFVAYPEGLNKVWNDFRKDPVDFSHRENIDDVGFVSALIDRLAAEYPIDKDRVYAAGMSNGGSMSYRLACELAGKLRGIAAVAASNPVDQAEFCRPSRPVNVMIINGTEDPIVPYNGGAVKVLGKERGKIISTEETVRFWAEFNKCAADPAIDVLPDLNPGDGTRVRRFSYGPCAGGTRVVLYRVEGGGHAWPGGYHFLLESQIGRTSRDFSASDEIWNFFRQSR